MAQGVRLNVATDVRMVVIIYVKIAVNLHAQKHAMVNVKTNVLDLL